MSLTEEVSYTDGVHQIKRVQFGLLSPAKIRAQSVVEVYRPFENSTDITPGTINDPKLGTSDRVPVNPISHLSIKYDPGHFGHLELAKPVITSSQAHKAIIKILNTVCYRCSRLRLDLEDPEIASNVRSRQGKNRFLYVTKEAAKNVGPCPHCTAPRVKFEHAKENKDQVFGIKANLMSKGGPRAKVKVTAEQSQTAIDEEETPQPTITSAIQTARDDHLLGHFNNDLCYYLLKNITDVDCALLGLDPQNSRPEWMLWTVMPIPPPSMRPSVENDDGLTASDDLTAKLNHIVLTNQTLMELVNDPSAKGVASSGWDFCQAPNDKITEWWCLLQYHVATYIDNELAGVRRATNNRSSRPLKTLRQRIKSKKGRIRLNLMGKRVDHSARSVITPDPNLSMDQLRIPLHIAMTLHRPERVTPYNIHFLTQLVRNGPDVYPGANYIKQETLTQEGVMKSRQKHLRYLDHKKVQLAIGDIVDRHLLDDDIVLLNRQPSLHKMSMMAHRAVIFPHSPAKTLSFDPNDTTPYNADFDGDEMNIHMVMSQQTRAELTYIAAVPQQIVSPQASRPVIGLVQDSLLSMYRYLSPGTRRYDASRHAERFDLGEVMRMVDFTEQYRGRLPPPTGYEDHPVTKISTPYWSAQALVSYVMPPALNYHTKEVEIAQGQVAPHTVFTKKTLGPSTNSVIHVTWNDFGPDATRLLIDGLKRLATQWMLRGGFSVGFQDIDVDLAIERHNQQTVATKIEKINKDFIEKVHRGLFPHPARRSIHDDFEAKIYEESDCIRSQVENDTYSKVPASNRIHNTVTAASKGSKTNVVQIMAILGQQSFDGGRVPDYFYRRSLPHFHKDNISPEAKGFIGDSFLRGLSPTNYWAHAQSGRYGVISTSIKTAESGYIQRKLVKVQEDVEVFYDSTVRNANHLILQVAYGGDGFDASRLENTPVAVFMDRRPDPRQAANRFNLVFSSMMLFTEEFSYLPDDSLTVHLTPNAYAATLQSRGEEEVKQHLNNTEFSALKELRRAFRTEVWPNSVPENIQAPFNLERLIEAVRQRFPNPYATATATLSDCNPIAVYERVDALIQELRNAIHPLPTVRHYIFRPIEGLLRCNLASKTVMRLGLTQVQFDAIIDEITKKVMEAIISPGEMVGSIAAQSIGEPTTQLTLNVFHSAGIGSKAKVSRGVPRMKEILDLSNNPKSPNYTLALRPEILYRGIDPAEIRPGLSSEEIKRQKEIMGANVKEVMNKLLYTTLRSIATGVRLIPLPATESPAAFATMLKDPHAPLTKESRTIAEAAASHPRWAEISSKGVSVIHFILNRAQMVKNLELFEIHLALHREIQALKEGPRKKRWRSLGIDYQYPDITSSTLYFQVLVYQESGPVELDLLRDLVGILEGSRVKGVYGIDEVYHRAIETPVFLTDGAARPASADKTEACVIPKTNEKFGQHATIRNHQMLIDTKNSLVLNSIYELFNQPELDHTRLYSDNIQEVMSVFGIEMARAVLVQELKDVLESADTYINIRHLELLADIMTVQGHLVSVSRYGVNKSDNGPWSRASFEETATQVTEAAIFAQNDQMTGVTPNIMFGQFIRAGTNAFDLVWDEPQVALHPPEKTQAAWERLRMEPQATVTTVRQADDICAVSNFDFNFG